MRRGRSVNRLGGFWRGPHPDGGLGEGSFYAPNRTGKAERTGDVLAGLVSEAGISVLVGESGSGESSTCLVNKRPGIHARVSSLERLALSKDWAKMIQIDRDTNIKGVLYGHIAGRRCACSSQAGLRAFCQTPLPRRGPI